MLPHRTGQCLLQSTSLASTIGPRNITSNLPYPAKYITYALNQLEPPLTDFLFRVMDMIGSQLSENRGVARRNNCIDSQSSLSAYS